MPNILLVKSSLNVASVEDLAKLVQSKESDISCASSGSLPTLGCELFKVRTRGNIIMVRYKGNAPALAALSQGEVTMIFDVANTAAEAVKAGRAKALATTNNEPMTGLFANLPLMKSKYEGFDLVSWQGLMVPRATPKATVDAINVAVNNVLKDPDIRKAFETAELIPVGGSAEQFGALIAADDTKYAAVVKDAGIQPECVIAAKQRTFCANYRVACLAVLAALTYLTHTPRNLSGAFFEFSDHGSLRVAVNLWGQRHEGQRAD